MRHPLKLSATGRYAEGLVELPGLWAGTDLAPPSGQRPAVYQTKGVVGVEADLEVVQGAAWIAIQLDKAARYRELVRQLIEQGALALAPGAMPRLATKSAAGMFDRLPLVEWGIQPLRVAGGTRRRPLPAALWTARRKPVDLPRPGHRRREYTCPRSLA